ncbi:MAG: preprotein translocase subunit TatC [Deltaproteobacteria bacterium]|nr:preprotein translocase subunit TatC [Deltaproteobacteria bacterium]MBU50200.1 preprotein translocase subunit TatC [Deltaproteobacteria bacterium]|tara:strand:+ start:36676 stop:37062 length:387 start_codon:yes stop_codon:yes gene_type:complete
MNSSVSSHSIGHQEIERLVTLFYRKVREDRQLGPLFHEVLLSEEAWSQHNDRMVSFWRSVMCGEGWYKGNPKKVHMELEPFDLMLFEHWLVLFEESTRELFSQEISALFMNKSRAIAAVLKATLKRVR